VETGVIVVIISALKRKVLFVCRLCLLLIVLTILVIQIHGMFKTEAPSRLADPVTAEAPPSNLLENLVEWLKEYYRGKSR
jgi:hypothetical protein